MFSARRPLQTPLTGVPLKRQRLLYLLPSLLQHGTLRVMAFLIWLPQPLLELKVET